MIRRLLAAPLALALMATAFRVPTPAAAQAARGPRVYLTVFRNPSTGIELRVGRIGVHAGFYPTILKTDTEQQGRNTNFVRVGAAFYTSADRTALYVAPSIVLSLDDRFDSGVLTDVGVRGRLGGPVAGRLGIGMLNTFDGELRINPTVGLDVRLGGRDR